jgi:hypothetical protein
MRKTCITLPGCALSLQAKNIQEHAAIAPSRGASSCTRGSASGPRHSAPCIVACSTATCNTKRKALALQGKSGAHPRHRGFTRAVFWAHRRQRPRISWAQRSRDMLSSRPTPTLLFSHLACESEANVLTTRTRNLRVCNYSSLFPFAHGSSCTSPWLRGRNLLEADTA